MRLLGRGCRTRAGAYGLARPGILGHRDGEDEPGALADPTALGADAAAVRLDQPLADDEPEAHAGGRPAAALGVRVLAEQVRQPLGGHAPALVPDRDGDVRAVTVGRDPDRGRVGRVPGGVREQVVQHLHDAPPVGHHPGQVRRQVDEHGVPAAGGQERAARPVDQGGHVRGLGCDRERARVDAPRIEQVADEAAHVVGLLGDDAVELVHLGPIELGRLLDQRVRRALDRGQRRAQLVAHHAEEVRPQPLQLLKRRQVLEGDDHPIRPPLHLSEWGSCWRAR
ncbi:MAG: hypothetical protein OXG04_19180 [Acidobacteria bacterium]|nr:hypothetical protein [Acidobacteriota bacterium]